MANLNRFRIAMPYLDEPGDGGGGGTPPAPPVNNDPPTPAPAAPVPAPTPANSGWEAEKKAFIADLQKERRARQQYEQQATTHKTELELERQRIRALTGATPQSAEQNDIDAVKQRFGQIYPELAGLTAEDIKGIRGLLSQSTHLQEATNHVWRNHGQKMLASVKAGLEKHLGGSLSERQTQKFERAYAAQAENDPAFLKRHEDGDQTLIDDFVKEWNEDFFEPAKRNALAQDVDRFRAVPNGKDRSLAAVGGKKIDVNDPKAVEDMLVEAYRARGGQFGRR